MISALLFGLFLLSYIRYSYTAAVACLFYTTYSPLILSSINAYLVDFINKNYNYSHLFIDV
uniref:Oligosaccharide repeat unit polymerase n=1 Tax=Macrostomum lignano TaxID=282301 RepID=A0A1I8FED9_9PLAT